MLPKDKREREHLIKFMTYNLSFLYYNEVPIVLINRVLDSQIFNNMKRSYYVLSNSTFEHYMYFGTVTCN